MPGIFQPINLRDGLIKVVSICLWIIFLHIFIYAQQNNVAEQTVVGNCETNSARLDYLRTQAIEAKTASQSNIVIAVARLGDGEYNTQLNVRRLYAVRKYLGSTVTNLITAQGERVKGSGRIEIYVYGTLKEVLLIEKCRDLPVGVCDNNLLDFKNYQLPLSRPKQKTKCQ